MPTVYVYSPFTAQVFGLNWYLFTAFWSDSCIVGRV